MFFIVNRQYYNMKEVKGKYSTFDSRYKFTAKELDSETQYTYFGARYLDSDISIWLSVDPFGALFPFESPYCYAGNNPVGNIDIGGNFQWPAGDEGDDLRARYPNAYKFLMSKDGILKITESELFITTLINNTVYAHKDKIDQMASFAPESNQFPFYSMDKSFELTKEKIIYAFTPGQGPYINFNDAPCKDQTAGGCNKFNVGDNYSKSTPMQINLYYLDLIEQSFKNTSDVKERQAALLPLTMIVTHEYLEYYSNDNIGINFSPGEGMEDIYFGCSSLSGQIWGFSYMMGINNFLLSPINNPKDQKAIPNVPMY